MGKLDRKIAVVTGGNSGIGLAKAYAFGMPPVSFCGAAAFLTLRGGPN